MPANAAKARCATDTVRFVLDGEVMALRDIDPTRTVLQFLREDLRRTGTKEGCAEGDCGACTVVLATLDGDGERLQFRAINSCIQFLPTLDGSELLTAESLQASNGDLHPVQRALVDCHGSQCGFCTPGFVMSMFALYKSKAAPSRQDIDDALAGNLCRCTGYRPIVSAAQTMYQYGEAIEAGDQNWMTRPCSRSSEHAPALGELEAVERLRSLARHDTLALASNGKRYFAPTNVNELVALASKHPDAHLLAGGTDVGLWVTKQHADLDTVIYVGNVQELKRLEVTATHIEVGAAVTLTDAVPVMVTHYPDLDELFRRFASPPIRNAGTLGGNVANGSPIGDSMPALIALGTTLVLRKGERTRELSLEAFYIAYQKTARESGEILESIRIPLPAPEMRLRAYKISKRFDQDISAVCGAYCLVLDGEKVRHVRIAYGGMAPIPKRAMACELAFTGRDWSERALEAAMTALDSDYAPITDMRASEQYRRRVARNLLHRFYLEISGEISGHASETRVYTYGR